METMQNVLNRRLDYACDRAEEPVAMDPQERYFTYMAEEANKREGTLHEVDGYVCELCKNRGFIAKAEWTDMGYWTRVDYTCTCMTIRGNIARMKKSGLQEAIVKCRFDTYHATEPWHDKVKRLAMDYAEGQLTGAEEGKWFFIGGASGTGKSHICTAICRELLYHGKEVHYMLWRDETVKLKAMVNDAAQYEKTMQELKTVEVLYIDDFFKCGQHDGGMQRPTAADIQLAFEILNYRYNRADAITIISSESTLDEIFALDEAVGGRIGERSKEYVISISGKEKNYRRKLMGIAV